MPKALAHSLHVAGSVLASTIALWRGTSVVKQAVAPARRLQLYDLEGCPYCRAVREALTALGLDAEIYPCPKDGEHYRAEAVALGGKLQFPLLVDPNTNTVMYQAQAIIDYLFRTYARRATPVMYRIGYLAPQVSGLGSLVRGMRGQHYRPSSPPKKLLELWSFESSPFSRLVRERLTELAIPYVLHNLGKEQFDEIGPATLRLQQLVTGKDYQPKKGGKRARVLKAHGRVQVPYLEDPNTGAKLYESAAIIDYLERTYAR